jgi:hypothetical protein
MSHSKDCIHMEPSAIEKAVVGSKIAEDLFFRDFDPNIVITKDYEELVINHPFKGILGVCFRR